MHSEPEAHASSASFLCSAIDRIPKNHAASGLTASLHTFRRKKQREGPTLLHKQHVMWEDIISAHGEEEFTSSDYSAFPANLVVQWKNGVKKIRIAWSNECAGMRRNYSDHDWGSLCEILPTDLVGTIWNGKLIAWHIWGTPYSKNRERYIFRSFTSIFSVN